MGSTVLLDRVAWGWFMHADPQPQLCVKAGTADKLSFGTGGQTPSSSTRGLVSFRG